MIIQVVHEENLSPPCTGIRERRVSHLCWHGGWVGSGLLVAEKQFRRVQGYKQIPNLLRELEALAPSKTAVVKRKKAS